MFELIILNLETGARFKKIFDSYYLKERFVKKCRYSKKVKVVAEFQH